MRKTISGLSALSLCLIATTQPEAAVARSHGHRVSIQGAGVRERAVTRQPGSVSARRDVDWNNGRGYETNRSRSCAPGACASSRSIQTNDGRGATTARSTSWGDGNYARSRVTTTNDGHSLSRTTSAHANGDGTADYSTTINGPDGGSRTVSGTVVRHNP